MLNLEDNIFSARDDTPFNLIVSFYILDVGSMQAYIISAHFWCNALRVVKRNGIDYSILCQQSTLSSP